MRRDDDRQVGLNHREHAVELMQGISGGTHALRLDATDFGQEDRRMGNQGAGDDAGHGSASGRRGLRPQGVDGVAIVLRRRAGGVGVVGARRREQDAA